MFDRLEDVVFRFQDLTDRLSAPDLNPNDIYKLNKERSDLEPIVEAYQSYRAKVQELADNKELLSEDDVELKAMAKEEISRLEPEIDQLEHDLKIMMLPKDPNDEKNIMLEVRAGTGGDEASLFAGELFKMYNHYAQSKGWKVSLISSSSGTMGGFKEVIAQISGPRVFSHLKYEAGTHRVQRVPQTESQGRVHTSACTVAILPEVDEVDIKIDKKDLRIDTMRAGGAGGQHVNKTESAVRITHLPTGIMVRCEEEKSQQMNREKAMTLLRSRVYDKKLAEQQSELAAERKNMVGSGDRSEKIRTYNFPQDRCTDHRAGVSIHGLPKLFSGNLDDILDPVRAKLQAEALKAQEAI